MKNENGNGDEVNGNRNIDVFEIVNLNKDPNDDENGNGDDVNGNRNIDVFESVNLNKQQDLFGEL